MSIHQQIQARIEAFASELGELVRKAAIEAVTTALGSGASSRTAAGRPTVKLAAGAMSSSQTDAAKPTISFKRKAGAKRTAEQLAAIDAAIVAFVSANSGKGAEHIAKALGVPSKDLTLRIPLLLNARKLKKTGVKRATKYFAA